MKTHTVKIVAEVTSKDIAYWVVTAFEGGSNYWMESADCAERTASGWHTFDTLMRVKLKLGVDLTEGPVYSLSQFWDDPHHGYVITIEDDEPVERVLTANRLLAGIQAMVSDGRHEEVGRLLNEEYDANDADTLVQYALFAEVVYG